MTLKPNWVPDCVFKKPSGCRFVSSPLFGLSTDPSIDRDGNVTGHYSVVWKCRTCGHGWCNDYTIEEYETATASPGQEARWPHSTHGAARQN